jgi:hypothetical protein
MYLLALIAVILSIMVFIAPAKLGLKTNKNPNGKIEFKFALIGLAILWLIFLYILGKGASKDIEGNTTSNIASSTATNTVSAKKNKTLGITSKDFLTRFTKLAKQSDFKPTSWTGTQDLENIPTNGEFTLMLDDNIYLKGDVNKTNSEIVRLTLLPSSDNNQLTAIHYLTYIGIVANTLNSDLPNDQAGGVAVQLFKDALGENTGKEVTKEKVVGNVTYMAYIDPNATGFSFFPN